MPRLTWRRQPDEQGRIERMIQNPRGAILKVDGKDVGTVTAVMSGGWDTHHVGWRWRVEECATLGIIKARSEKPLADVKAAKAECEAHVRRCLEARS